MTNRSAPTTWQLTTVAACLLLVGTTSACSTIEIETSAGSSSSTVPSSTVPATSLPSSTVPSSTVPATSLPSSTVPATSLPPRESAAPGRTFVDPQGVYELFVPASWEANHGTVVAEIEAWLVDEPRGGFVANVNVLVQAAPGLTLDDYLELSVANAPLFAADLEVSEASLIDGDQGQPLAMMEYTAGDLSFLGVFAMTADGQAIVATLSVLHDDYESVRADVLPHLSTLMPLHRPGGVAPATG